MTTEIKPFHPAPERMRSPMIREGMDGSGLKQHWSIGKSDKRELAKLPLGRQQIGKFGIGKLASSSKPLPLLRVVLPRAQTPG
jgi:hypothetical protein